MVAAAVLMLFGASLGFLTWRNWARADDRLAPRVRGLVDALSGERVIEARLTGGFPYGRLKSDTRGGSVPTGNLTLLAAAGALQKQADRDPAAENMWSFGLAEVLIGQYDRGIRDIYDAIAASPNVARFHSDSAAAHLARAGSRVDALQDLARALDGAERALALDATLIEAQFNKALALERAGLRGAAADAWTQYLSADGTSGWAQEARAHLDVLRASPVTTDECVEVVPVAPGQVKDLVRRCPQQLREHAESVLAGWARAFLDGDPERTRRLLETLAALATEFRAEFEDDFLSDASAAITRRPDRQGALAQGHLALARGRTLYDSDKRHEARDFFRKALVLLRTADDPYWLWAQHSLATIHTHRRELPEALALLDEIDVVAASKRYRAVQARSSWLYGVVNLQRGDPSAALEHYHDAARRFAQLRETGNVSNVLNAAADTERIIGDFARGWQSLSASLSRLNTVADPTRRYLAYYNASLFAKREGLPFAALRYQEEALSAATARKGPAGVIEASINRASLLGRVGRIDDAQRSFSDGTRLIADLNDPQQRAYMTARVAAARGEVLIQHDAPQAAAELDGAIRYFAAFEPAETPRLLLLKGMALERAGNKGASSQAYSDGIGRFETRLLRLPLDEQRISYSDEGWDLYRRLVQQQLADGFVDEALALSDRARSRARVSEPLRLDDLQSALGPDRHIVYFTVLERETHAWVITASAVRHHRLAVSEADLQTRAALVWRLLPGGHRSSSLSAALRGLHDAVIAPLGIADSTREVIIVPDGPLRLVPFAALIDSTGSFLVRKSAISLASSLRVLVDSGRTMGVAEARRAASEALAVGEPLPDREKWPDLTPLPFARQEATAVASMYERSTLLAREAATKTRLLAKLPSADVFHFAGHAIANDEFPELSSLVLTPGAVDRGELLARDLRTARLKPGAIVVLSACQTGFGPVRRAAGVQSLAQAFLSMGAGSVVAAAWEVEDRDTSEIMTAFHEALSKGVASGSALRLAQIRQIDAARPVSSWAPFVQFVTQIRSR